MQPDLPSDSARLAAIVESSSDAIISKDLNGIVTSWNRAAEAIFGYTAEEMIGASILRIIPAARRQEEAHILGQIRRCEKVEHFETQRLTKSGRLIDISVSASPIKNELGEVVGVSKVARDIGEQKQAARALDLSNRRFQEVLETVELIAIILDPTGKVSLCNDYLLRVTGWRRDEVVGMEYFLRFLPEPVTVVKSLYLDNIAAGTIPKHYQNPIKTRTGALRTIAWNNTILRDATGTVTGLASIGEDITERVEAETAHQKSEARYRVLFDCAPEGILIAGPGNTYLDANARICRMLGYSHDELVGLNVADVLATEEQPHIAETLRAIHGQASHRAEWKFRRKDGSLFLAEVNASITPDGNILGIIRDITERHRAEQVLRSIKREQSGRNKAGILRDFLLVLGLGLTVLIVLRTTDLIELPFDRLLTRFTSDLDEIFGMSIVMLAGFMVFAYRRWKEAKIRLNEQSNVEEALRILHEELERRVQQRTAELTEATSALREEIVRRQREQEQREKLEVQFRQAQKMEGIGQLAGGVAHDFNNILAVIQMQSELLKVSGQLTATQTKFADEIGVTVQRAAALTRQLLLFSRQEVFQPRDLDLSDSLAATAKMLTRILGEDIEMKLVLSPDPMFIHADPGMMDQVLLNLAVNARDAMPQGGKLIIKTEAVEIDAFAAAQLPQAAPGSFVCLSVSDTGCGIRPEILPRIFEPFFTTKDVGKGTGLGLATVFGIAQQHQGWVNVYSEVGRGTTFRVYLPRLNQTPHIAVPALAGAVQGGHETLLVVEDDAALRLSIERTLAQLGYQVLIAATGAQALELWQKNRLAIQLVLTDLVMPEQMSGKQLAERLREDSPLLPIIYMSGYSVEVAGRDFSTRAGINFLAKPFKAQVLAQAVRQQLDEQKRPPSFPEIEPANQGRGSPGKL